MNSHAYNILNDAYFSSIWYKERVWMLVGLLTETDFLAYAYNVATGSLSLQIPGVINFMGRFWKLDFP